MRMNDVVLDLIVTVRGVLIIDVRRGIGRGHDGRRRRGRLLQPPHQSFLSIGDGQHLRTGILRVHKTQQSTIQWILQAHFVDGRRNEPAGGRGDLRSIISVQ